MADKPAPESQPGGFFGNATRGARRNAAQPKRETRTHVLRCPGCGAARERTDLVCRYCGGSTTE